MKTRMKILAVLVVITGLSLPVQAQKVDEERMRRDIEVAENVLATLIKQEIKNQGTFFPLEIKGSYQPGYGVTFHLPADFTTPIFLSVPAAPSPDPVIVFSGDDEDRVTSHSFSYSFSGSDDMELAVEEAEEAAEEMARADAKVSRLKNKSKERRRSDLDSVRNTYNNKVIDAAKTFIVDYSEIITQLPANEKIIISNQGNQPRVWVNQYFNSPKRTHLSVEAVRADLNGFRQGKMSRDQAFGKIKVVNTETVKEIEPDLELLVTMFNRLYRPDLSKTYFTENNIYYERLKDFGVIYYMSVYSGTETAPRRFRMPTLGLENVDAETRNKKVKELYPVFEQEFKENLLEYGRTVKSLKDNEALHFQVQMTRCTGCGIPSTVEFVVKGSVLKDYNSGKADRNQALKSISVRQGAPQ